jgi:WD40 repeat protein/tRNA A-37 threonylcarbamoyl transferase component Bud32
MTETETAAHPRPERLRAYAQGRLVGPEMDEIEHHLSSCDECSRAALEAPGDWFLAAVRATGGATTAAPVAGFEVPSSFLLKPDRGPRAGDGGLPEGLVDHPRYRVAGVIGSGGMGTVYRAEHRLMDRPVALKVIRRDLLGSESLVERFRREVRAAARLAPHPNVVAAYDAEEVGDTHVLVMEYVEGTDLARLVEARGRLPVGEACEYARQAALGLQHALENGMVHRDIKPQNLMRTNRGQVKVLDFGLARFASEVGTGAGLTALGTVLGSADYMAPEQVEDPHAADIRADIYSLGCTLYHLLTGVPPFPGRGLMGKLRAHAESTPTPLAAVRGDVPPELERVVARMTAKAPADRYATPAEVAEALAPFAEAMAEGPAAIGDVPTLPADSPSLATTWPDAGATPWPAKAPGPDHAPGRRWPLIAAAALALLAAGVGAWGLVTYRVRTATGELVIQSDDPDIKVVVTQGGRRVTIVDAKTGSRVALAEGRYEVRLDRAGTDLRLSRDAFTIERGGRTIVTVRREPAPAPTSPRPGPDLLAGTEEVGEIARFESPHDLPGWAFFLPDGRHLVYTTGGDNQDGKWVDGVDPALWVVDLSDPRNPRKLTGHAPKVGGIRLAIAPDGRLALTAGADGTVRLWDLETGRSGRLRREGGIMVHGGVCLAPDGQAAAYAFREVIRLLDLKTGSVLKTFRGHQRDRIEGLAFCDGGRRLVSASTDRTVRVWEVASGQEVRRMSHGHGVAGLAVFPDGRRALTSSWDWTIAVWDLETGRQLRRIDGVANRFGATVAVSPDGRRALFGADKTILLWDLETGEEIERLEGHTDGVWHVAFSPDGRRAVSSSMDKTVRVWGLPRGRSPGEEPPVVEVAHLLDGPVNFGKSPRVNGEQAAVSADGKLVLAAGGDGTVRLWDRESGEVVRRLEGHKGQVMCVAFSPDGRRALSAGEDKIVRVWDLTTGRLAHELRGHTEWVFGLAVSPDGRRAYSCGGGSRGKPWTSGTDLAVRVWDLDEGREVRRLEGHAGLVWSVAASSDGRYVLSGGFDATPVLWDAATGAELRRFRGHTDKVMCVTFLPGGRRAISSGVDKTIRVWDVETGEEVACLRGHPGEVTWVAASPDGRRLLSSDVHGRELRLWDVDTRALIHRFDWGGVGPLRGAFFPDGRHAAWPGTDGVVRLHRLPPVTNRPSAGAGR